MQNFADWLQKDLHFPHPLLMAYLRTGAELFGVIMLVLSLFTRIRAFLIMFTMFVTFFSAGKAAFLSDGETVFAYAIVILTLVLTGAGKISLDYYFFGRGRWKFVVVCGDTDNNKRKINSLINRILSENNVTVEIEAGWFWLDLLIKYYTKISLCLNFAKRDFVFHKSPIYLPPTFLI